MATPIVSTLNFHHRINGLVVGIVQATIQESVCLFLQGFKIEFRGTALAEQKTVQERYRNVSIGSAFTQDVLARVLVDCAIIGVLRKDGR